MKFPDFLTGAFAAVDQFCARHWRKFVLAGGLILVGLTARTCLEAGRYQNAVQQNPPLSKRQANTLVRRARDAQQAAHQAKAQADTVLRLVVVREVHLATQLHLIDSLTTRYHALRPDSTASAAAVQHFLATYQPGPDNL